MEYEHLPSSELKRSYSGRPSNTFGNALGNGIVGAIQQADFDGNLSNLSGGARQAYDNVIERGYTPQQALAYAQDFQGIEGPISRPTAGAPSVADLTADQLGVDLSGLPGAGNISLNIARSTQESNAIVSAMNREQAGGSYQAQVARDFAGINESLNADFADFNFQRAQYQANLETSNAGSLFGGAADSLTPQSSGFASRSAAIESDRVSTAAFIDQMRGSVAGDLAANALTLLTNSGSALLETGNFIGSLAIDGDFGRQVYRGAVEALSDPGRLYDTAVDRTSLFFDESISDQATAFGQASLNFLTGLGAGEAVKLGASGLVKVGAYALDNIGAGPVFGSPSAQIGAVGDLSRSGFPDGPNSYYTQQGTARGSRYPNVSTNVTAPEFQANLEANGYKVVGSDRGATRLSNGTSAYSIYVRESTGVVGAQYFGPTGNSVKFSLNVPRPILP